MTRRLAAVLVGALALAAAPAFAEVDTSTAVEAREAALFGDPGGVEDREAALFGGETASVAATRPDDDVSGTEARLLDALRDKDDVLDIGGVLWMRLDLAALEGTPVERSRLSSPSFTDVYLDARPSDRLRFYARGRLNYDPTVDADGPGLLGAPAQTTRARLDQLWLKLDLVRRVFVTAGKQRIRWGTGRIWNPTDFLNPNRRDSLDFLDVRLGVTLIKIHVPIESLGWNFYAIADLDGATAVNEVGGALRAEMLLGPAELALSGVLRKDEPVRLGADLSLPVGEVDFRVEAALLHDLRRAFFDERTDASVVDDIERIEDVATFNEVFAAARGQRVDRSGDWIPQVVVGVDYAFRFNVDDIATFSLEYFFNDAGTSRTQTYLPLVINGGFEALFVGRHYLSAAAILVGPGSWDDSTFSLVGLANLSDRSGLVRFNYSVRVLTFLRVNAFASAFVGNRGGEFRLRFRVPPTDPEVIGELEDIAMQTGQVVPDDARALVDGFEFLPPRAQIGVAVVLDF